MYLWEKYYSISRFFLFILNFLAQKAEILKLEYFYPEILSKILGLCLEVLEFDHDQDSKKEKCIFSSLT
jgi:hypothetical protein